VLKKRKRSIGAEGRQIALAGSKDHIVSKITLDRRDRNAGGIISYLHCGVDDASIVLAVFLCGHKIYAVCKIVKSFCIHSIPSYSVELLFCGNIPAAFTAGINIQLDYELTEVSFQQTCERSAVASLGP
jgi:hypothetical protein